MRFINYVEAISSMTKDSDGLALLPNGFSDLLPPRAEAEDATVRGLIDCFLSFGYQLTKPPLVEFEESLLAPGPGERLASKTFRLMDPMSDRMLGVRSDVTAQISRIATARLASEPMPLRLTYANDVLRTRGDQIRSKRQFTQVGCEVIHDHVCLDTDIEVCVLAILGLKAVGLQDITLDLNLPRFLSAFVGEALDDTILKAVAQRDGETLSRCGIGNASVLADVVGWGNDPITVFANLLNMDVDDGLRQDILHLQHIFEGISKALKQLAVDDVAITLDVLEQEGFEYHTRFGFSLFSSHIHGELGRGGAYDVCFNQAQNDELCSTSKGFTLYMDTIAGAIDVKANGKYVFVPSLEPWNVLADLQGQGWRVVRGFEAPSGCDFIYENGHIKEYKREG